MLIAVSSEGTELLQAAVSQHFGRCPYYTLVEVQDGQIGQVTVVDNPHFGNHSPGVVPEFVHRQGATVILAGGMGHRAIGMFTSLGIGAVTGAEGTVADALQAYLDGRLRSTDPCHQSAHGCGRGAGHGQP